MPITSQSFREVVAYATYTGAIAAPRLLLEREPLEIALGDDLVLVEGIVVVIGRGAVRDVVVLIVIVARGAVRDVVVVVVIVARGAVRDVVVLIVVVVRGRVGGGIRVPVRRLPVRAPRRGPRPHR